MTVRQPSQQRARDTIDRILDAGAELIVEHGYAGFGITDVCQHAAISAGGLYRYFDSKETLVLAVQERELGRLDTELAAALDPQHWTTSTLVEAIEGGVRALATQYRSHEGILRAFIMHSGADPEMRAHSSLMVREGMRRYFSNLLLTRQEQMAFPDPTRAVDACFRLVFGSLSWRVGFGADFESTIAHLDWDEWTDYLVSVAQRQLAPRA